MTFKKLCLDDIPKIRTYFELIKTGSCDYSVGGMFMWRDYYKMEYFIEDDVFFSRLYNKSGKCYYNIPIGKDIKKNIERLIQTYGDISFCTIPENMLELFQTMDLNLKIVEQPNFSDYLYNASDLINLNGKKFGGQRNLVHQFLRENTDWTYEKISVGIIEEIKLFLKTEYEIPSDAKDFEIEEENKVFEVLDNYKLYDFVGSVLKANGKIIGFSIGEIIGDTLFVHIEKANRNIKGVYQMLVNLFAKEYCNETIKFINREEDMGDIGLRTSKLSYHPTNLIRKYIVEVKK